MYRLLTATVNFGYAYRMMSKITSLVAFKRRKAPATHRHVKPGTVTRLGGRKLELLVVDDYLTPELVAAHKHLQST